jgi:hypothetical protein
MDHLAFEAFLSHRYKSPDVNLYFYNLFTETASVQFRVDIGSQSLSTARLERLIREAQGFIGIYSIPGDTMHTPDIQSLMHLSRYFRLELDMAIRSRKPAIIFSDNRYHGLFGALPGIQQHHYDAQEILSRSGWPDRDRVSEEFRSFCTVVQKLRAITTPVHQRGTVGLVVPAVGDRRLDECAGVVEQVVHERGCKVRVVPWPIQLDLATQKAIRECDWMIVETSAPESTPLVAYLHGQFVPMIRIRHVASGHPTAPVAEGERMLFSGVEVGYLSDLLSWADLEALGDDLRARVSTLLGTGRRINDPPAAESYFKSAAQRKERVFLSYTREDEDYAGVLGAALRDRFQEVFDYRDGKSIAFGRPWQDEVFDSLSKTAVGVTLLSRSYFESEYCKQEARVMMDKQLSGKLLLFPIRLDDVAVPAYLNTIENRKVSAGSPQQIVDEIIRALPRE